MGLFVAAGLSMLPLTSATHVVPPSEGLLTVKAALPAAVVAPADSPHDMTSMPLPAVVQIGELGGWGVCVPLSVWAFRYVCVLFRVGCTFV